MTRNTKDARNKLKTSTARSVGDVAAALLLEAVPLVRETARLRYVLLAGTSAPEDVVARSALRGRERVREGTR